MTVQRMPNEQAQQDVSAQSIEKDAAYPIG